MSLNFTRVLTRSRKLAVANYKSTTQINLKWLSHLGTHWTKHGLMPPLSDSVGWFWRWRPLLGFIISFSFFFKTLIMIYNDTYNFPDLAITYGDVFAFATATHASWFYCNMVHLLGYVYTASFHLHVALQEQRDITESNILWLEVLNLMKNGYYGQMMGERSGRKILKLAAAVSKTLSRTIPACLALYGLLLSLPYLLSLPANWLILGILHGIHYILYALVGLMVAIKAAYFLCLCIYVSYSLDGINGKLLMAMNIYGKRRWIGKYISQQINSITTCLDLIRSCNGFYGEKIKPLLITLLFATLGYLYTLPTAEGVSDYLVLGFGIVFCSFNIIYFFTAASLVKRKLILSYRILNQLQLKAKGFRAKWPIMLMLEMISSKKKRVGFEVKDWCKLNNWSLLKVIVFNSYFQYRFKKSFTL